MTSTENSERVAADQESGRQASTASTTPRVTFERAGPLEPAIEGLDETTVAHFLEEHAIDAALVRPGVPTPSVPDAARALGVPADAIIKSLVFEVEGEPYLVIAAGEQRIDYKRLAAAFGISRKKVRMAAPASALSATGFPIGAMPPFGHARRLRTLVDSLSVRRGATVYGGGGTDSTMMRVAVDTILDVTEARYLPLTVEELAPTVDGAPS